MASGSTPRTIVFSHGNSFPAGTYRVLFDVWEAAGWRVHAVEAFGHDPRYPASSNWPHLVEELSAFIAALDTPAPAPAPALVGHSLGGLLSLMVACKHPQQASALVMLDSPAISGWRAQSLHALKASRMIARVSPGKVSRHRRHEWPSLDAVQAHFAAKAAFARWDPRVLADYVRSGFVEQDDGHVQLRFSREIETRIYDTLPHHLGTLVHRHPPRCPVSFIAGTQSAEMRAGGVGTAKALARERFRWIEGTHLYPMEKPDETAQAVLEALKASR